ncbi:copper transporter [Nocardioides caldifontis]|uniref:copper transporter n=1 Tax=Nocardioides caldifontis TaxID=2588938 RepID=UPI0013969A24|nr:copper transporter [Nocardioides caldifontis]
MISFRYHVVSLLAVLLALAVGIAVGSGPLQRDDDGGDGDEPSGAAESEVSELESRLAFYDEYARASTGALLGTALQGRAVTLLLLPGATDAAVTDAADAVTSAGGTVTARAVLDQQLLDVGERQLVEQLAAQMAEQAGRAVEVPGDASGYEAMGLLIAHALATTTPAGQPQDEAGESVLAGLATAELAEVQGDLDRRGSLVLAVGGPPYGSADERQGAGTILATLLTAIDSRSDGVVLTGPLASAGEDGLVGALRRDPVAAAQVSTVDVGGTVGGAVVSAMALAGEGAGRSGHYGSSAAADGAVPGAGGE